MRATLPWCAVLVALGARAAMAAEPPLQALARDFVGAGQGVFVQADDGTVLASQAADRAVHPASVTKVATTLALLQRLGPDHRFTTRFLADGPVRDGTIHGDLVVEADGDPFLVDETAARILERLAARGVRRVAGDVVVRGPLLFDWQTDPDGRGLRAALGGRIDPGAWRAAVGDEPRERDCALRVEGGTGGAEGAAVPLVSVRSPALRIMVKALNGYSNNVFHLLSDAIGGPATVEAIARASLPADVPAGEVVLDNGAGAGTTNRLSPRAAVAILTALGRELTRHGLDYPDVLPVSGIDAGTLAERLDLGARGTVVGKTGTYGDVGASALAGVLRTPRHGRVRFAILNSWVPVPEARRRQDAFVRALVDAEGAEPWPYTRDPRPPVLAATVE